MNQNIKILLTIELEEGLRVRSEEPEFIPYIIKNREGKIVKQGKRKHYPLISRGKATQHININEDAYNHFLKTAPNGKMQNWKKRSVKERIEAHLEQICLNQKGKSFTYEILED